MQPSLVIFSILQNMLHLLHIPITKLRLQHLISEQMYHGSIRTITEQMGTFGADSYGLLISELPKIHYHLTDLKLKRTLTTDGIGNCLQQPGHIRNQRYTLIESLHPFINISVP